MRTRAYYIGRIGGAIGNPSCVDEQRAILEALALHAALIGNVMSPNTAGYSEAHITESAEQIVAIVDETFGLEV